MRATNQNQREMREMAARHDTGEDARAREIRAENARRTLAAQPVREGRDLTWLARDVMSTPFAMTRS